MTAQNQYLIGSVLSLLSLGALYRSHRSNRHRRLIQVLPTSRVQGVFIGLVEVKGTAETESPWRSYLAEEPCVLYSWTVGEHWRREVTETYTDNEGRTQTRTRVESGVTAVASGGESAPFYLRDETGHLLLHPDGAEVRPRTLFSSTCGPMDPLYYGKGPAWGVPDSTHTRTFTETGIRLHDLLYVVGKAREREDVVAPEIAADEQSPMYLLTVESEEQVIGRLGRSMGMWVLLSMALAAGAGYLMGEVQSDAAAVVWAIGGAAIIFGLWSLTWIWMVYNSLIDARNRTRQGWSQVEVQLARRRDLIPSLISTVQGLCGHEEGVLSAVAALRSHTDDSHATGRDALVLAERYPVLKTSEAFVSLQRELIQTEQRIALARSYFNDVATGYNNRIEVFPDNVIGRLTGFQRQPLMEAGEFERAEVRVDFAS